MSRSVRLFEILQILRQAKKPVTAKILADALEVNVRTIYRDVASLQASKIPIEGEAGIGYIMLKGFDLPPLMFSRSELEAIVVGLSLLGRSGDSGLINAAKTVTSKISDVLPSDEALAVPLHVSHWNKIPHSNIQPQKLRDIIRLHDEIDITYLDLKAQTTRRIVQPIGLYYYIDVIILVAWCKLRNAFRHFRIDRIQSWQRTGTHFADIAERLREDWESLQNQE